LLQSSPQSSGGQQPPGSSGPPTGAPPQQQYGGFSGGPPPASYSQFRGPPPQQQQPQQFSSASGKASNAFEYNCMRNQYTCSFSLIDLFGVAKEETTPLKLFSFWGWLDCQQDYMALRWVGLYLIIVKMEPIECKCLVKHN
jgi:hypothetical protein